MTGGAIGPVAVRMAGVMARLAGWSPDLFWNATPAEAAMVLAAWADTDAGSVPPPDAETRMRLMEQFPDERSCG